MAFDPSIIMGYRGIGELPNPMNQLAQVSQIQNAQNQNALAQYQLSSAQRADEQQRSLYAAAANPDFKLDVNTALRYGPAGIAALKAQQEAQAAGLTQEKLRGEILAQTPKLQNDVSEQFKKQLTNVNDYNSAVNWLDKQYKHPVLGPLMAQMPFEEAVRQIPQDPAKFEDWKNKNALGIEKYIEQNKAQLSSKDIGGSVIDRTFNPLSNKITEISTTKKTPTFADITSQGQLAVSQGQLKVAQDRLLKDGAALDPAENAAISKAIIEGRLDPNRVNGRNAKILATTLLANPDANVLELGVSASGATAAERSLATQTAKMSTAANEANKMADVVRGLSDKVDRTEFPTINAITNAVSKGTGGKEIVQLNASINALVNSYARAISPTGQPTVSDKNHAREVINSAYSTGQISAILDVMQQEMSIAREAAGTASTELKASRETARGRGEKPATSGGALSAAEQTELDQLRQRFKK